MAAAGAGPQKKGSPRPPAPAGGRGLFCVPYNKFFYLSLLVRGRVLTTTPRSLLFFFSSSPYSSHHPKIMSTTANKLLVSQLGAISVDFEESQLDASQQKSMMKLIVSSYIHSQNACDNEIFLELAALVTGETLSSTLFNVYSAAICRIVDIRVQKDASFLVEFGKLVIRVTLDPRSLPAAPLVLCLSAHLNPGTVCLLATLMHECSEALRGTSHATIGGLWNSTPLFDLSRALVCSIDASFGAETCEGKFIHNTFDFLLESMAYISTHDSTGLLSALITHPLLRGRATEKRFMDFVFAAAADDESSCFNAFSLLCRTFPRLPGPHKCPKVWSLLRYGLASRISGVQKRAMHMLTLCLKRWYAPTPQASAGSEGTGEANSDGSSDAAAHLIAEEKVDARAEVHAGYKEAEERWSIYFAL